MNPLDGAGDADGDGLFNLREYLAGTDPFGRGHGRRWNADGWEMGNGLNPLLEDAEFDGEGTGCPIYRNTVRPRIPGMRTRMMTG